MIFLTSKSILDCTVLEEEQHNDEVNEILDIILSMNNYDCIAVIKRDVGEENISFNLHDLIDLIQHFDFKNGLDICAGDNDILCFKIYGQIRDDKITEVTIHVIAIENGEPIDLVANIKSNYSNSSKCIIN